MATVEIMDTTDLQQLVGRTFEKNGLSRIITRIEGGNVYWRRPNGAEQKRPKWWAHWREWMAGAKEIN